MAATIKNWQDNVPPQVNAADVNGFKNENNNLIISAGATLDTGDNNQTARAVSTYAGAAAFYTDGGVANQYALSPVDNRLTPFGYSFGLQLNFVPANTNTGPSTVNVGSLGVKSIKMPNGDDTPSSAIRKGEYISVYYDPSGEFRIIGRYEIITGGFTGEVKFGYFTEAQPGWLLYRNGTIGNPTSGATLIASIEAQKLFIFLWDLFPDSLAPVSGGRGSSASEDFDANKTLKLPDIETRAIAIYNSVYPLGSVFGELQHTLTVDQMPSHNHRISAIASRGGTVVVKEGSDENCSIEGDFSPNTDHTGEGQPFNIIQNTTFMSAQIKL